MPNAPQYQSGLQRQEAQARHLRHQSRPRLRHFHHRWRARDQLAEHAGTGENFRGHGVRGAGADRTLARIRRGHQFQRPGLRVLFLGLGDRRLDALFRHLRHLACADHPPGDGGEAGGDHRPRHRRPLRAQYRHRLEPARDRNVRLAADGDNDRYDCAAEWLHILKELWTRDEPFDLEGRFYKIKRGYLEPKPIQKPFPPVMNAGGSDKGQHFAAKYCDMVYVVFGSHDFDDCKAKVDSYRELARKEYGRDIQVWSYAYVVQGDTEKEAKDYFEDYVNAKGDWEAVSNLVETMIANAKTLPPPVLAEMKKHFIAGWGGYPLVGTPEQIVDGLVRMSKMGLDGTLLNWPRYIEDQRWFKDKIYPLVQQAGLR